MRRVLVAIILGLSIFSFSIPIKVHAAPTLPTVDTSASKYCQAESCNVAISPSGDNELLIVFTGDNSTSGNPTVTDTYGITYKLRTSQGQSNACSCSPGAIVQLKEYYGFTGPLPSPSDTITFDTGQFISFSALIVVAVFGAQPLQFDPSSSLPLRGSSPANIPAVATVQPLRLNGLSIIAGIAAISISQPFTPYTNLATNGFFMAAEDTRWNSPGNFGGGWSAATTAFAAIADVIDAPQPGGSLPSSPNFQSVPGPGGLPIPPQLGDNGVLGFIFLVSATIGLSSLEFPKREKKTRSVYG